MNDFIATNPAVAKWLIGVLAALISCLVYGILFFVKRSFDNLTSAITSLGHRFDIGQLDMSTLKDRMAKQETICVMQRSLCPNKNFFPTAEKTVTAPLPGVPVQ